MVVLQSPLADIGTKIANTGIYVVALVMGAIIMYEGSSALLELTRALVSGYFGSWERYLLAGALGLAISTNANNIMTSLQGMVEGQIATISANNFIVDYLNFSASDLLSIFHWLGVLSLFVGGLLVGGPSFLEAFSSMGIFTHRGMLASASLKLMILLMFGGGFISMLRITQMPPIPSIFVRLGLA